MAAEFDDLLELEYEGLKLPCADWSYTGGNEFADHRAYLRPSAYQEPLGRSPYAGSFKCPMYNAPELTREYGQLYPLLCERIRGRFEERPRGRLVHPVLGALTVALSKWTFSASSNERNGQELSFEWVEHTDSIAEVLGAGDGTPQGVQAQAERADAAVAAVDRTAPPIAPTVRTQLAAATSVRASYSESVTGFQTILASVDSLRTRASLAVAQASEAQLELERLRARVDELRAQFVSNQPARTFTTPRTMALIEVSAEVYGVVSTIALTQLQLANGAVLSSPLAIPSGTVLRIPALINV